MCVCVCVGVCGLYIVHMKRKHEAITAREPSRHDSEELELEAKREKARVGMAKLRAKRKAAQELLRLGIPVAEPPATESKEEKVRRLARVRAEKRRDKVNPDRKRRFRVPIESENYEFDMLVRKASYDDEDDDDSKSEEEDKETRDRRLTKLRMRRLRERRGQEKHDKHFSDIAYTALYGPGGMHELHPEIYTTSCWPAIASHPDTEELCRISDRLTSDLLRVARAKVSSGTSAAH